MSGNANFPKCKNCIERGCDAGEVNHAFAHNRRLKCVLGCGCVQFKADKWDYEIRSSHAERGEELTDHSANSLAPLITPMVGSSGEGPT